MSLFQPWRNPEKEHRLTMRGGESDWSWLGSGVTISMSGRKKGSGRNKRKRGRHPSKAEKSRPKAKGPVLSEVTPGDSQIVTLCSACYREAGVSGGYSQRAGTSHACASCSAPITEGVSVRLGALRSARAHTRRQGAPLTHLP